MGYAVIVGLKNKGRMNMKRFNVVVEVERVYLVEAEDEQEALRNYEQSDYDESVVGVVDVEEGD